MIREPILDILLMRRLPDPSTFSGQAYEEAITEPITGSLGYGLHQKA